MAVKGADIADRAATKLGSKYVFGDEGPNTFDCSGLVQWAYKQFGINLPRTTYEQVKVGADVPLAQVQPGDLVFTTWGSTKNGHVGIYVGDNKIINAPHAGSVVRYQELTSSYRAHISAVRRPPGIDGGPPTSARFPNGLPDLPGWVVTPDDAVGALNNIGKALGSLAESAQAIPKIADGITKLFLPNNILRGALFFFGIAAIATGMWRISKEIR